MYLAYPLILVASVMFWDFCRNVSSGSDIAYSWSLILLTGAMIAEVVFRGGFGFCRAQIWPDLFFFFFIIGVFGGGSVFISVHIGDFFASVLNNPARNWPNYIAIPVSFVLADFFVYWWHRATHQIPVLWRWHKLHHETEELYPLKAAVAYPVDIIVPTICRLLPLSLMGFQAEIIMMHTIMFAISGAINHTGIQLRAGWLNYFFQTPELHKMHHSANPEEAMNYGTSLTFWDHVFGTYLYKPGIVPEIYGLENPDERSNGVWMALTQPFRPSS
jgi:sterol desaturase/sphingolipid hydroxylase (fatty acid hydroxylase superfamily)